MGLRLLNPARFPRARSPPASPVAEGTVGWAGGGGGSPYTRSSRRFLQTSMTACPAPAKTVVPASTKSTPSSASACPATAVAAARKVGTRCVPRVCCHGVGETPTGTLPSPCPFGGRHGELGRGWKSPAPSVMGSLFPASLPGVLGDRFPSPCPSPTQTRRAVTTTGTSSRVTATGTLPAGAPGRTRSGIAVAVPATSPASTRRRSTASSTVWAGGGEHPIPQLSKHQHPRVLFAFTVRAVGASLRRLRAREHLDRAQ